MKIVLGKAAGGGRQISIDLATFIPTRGLVTSDSGGGKSWLLRRIIEQTFGKIQIIVIDYEGEFSSLREKLDFALAAPGGETPADVRSAALLAQRALEFRFSLIADIYEMKPKERHTWVRLFLESLIDAPKKFWHPVLVIVDEAHVFCPEHGKGESEASEAMIALCTRGRKRGFCALWASQRLAAVNKDATSMLLNRMIGPTFEDVNRKRAADVLGVGENKKDRDAFYKEIQLLEPGNFYCLGRAISRDRVMVHVGPVETTHPETGSSKHSYEPPPPSAKIRALLPQLGDLPKTAEEKARTVGELQREIRELKAQLKKSSNAVIHAIHTNTVPVPDTKAVERAVRKAHVQLCAELAGRDRVISRLASATRGAAEAITSAIERIPKFDPIKLDGVGDSGLISLRPIDATRLKGTYSKIDRPKPQILDGELTPYQQSMIDALADLEAIGKTEPSWPLVGAAAGKSSGSSTFERYAAQLRSSGFVDYPQSNRLRLTEEGRNRARASSQPLSSQDIQERALKLLTPYQADILRVLISEYPKELPIEQLGELSGKAHGSSTFERYTAALISMEMAERLRPKTLKAADWMFVE